jgi:hypothetical protein
MDPILVSWYCGYATNPTKARFTGDRTQPFIATGHVGVHNEIVTEPDAPDESEAGPSIFALWPGPPRTATPN